MDNGDISRDRRIMERLQLIIDSNDLPVESVRATALLASTSISSASRHAACTIAVFRRTEALTVSSSHSAALRLDQAQHRYPTSPCRTAAVSGTIVRVKDTGNATVDLDLAFAMTDTGYTSLLAVPVSIGTEFLGAMTLYVQDARALSKESVQVAARLADQVASPLRSVVEGALEPTTDSALAEALGFRAVTEQAAEILLVTHGYNQEDALAWMLEQSIEQGIPMGEVAAGVIRSLPPGP